MRSSQTRITLAIVSTMTFVTVIIGAAELPLQAQTPKGRAPAVSTHQTAEQPSFEVASVKANMSDDPADSNFSLGPGDVYTPNGGRFSATNFPLITYIYFAYRIIGDQLQSLLSQLPAWVATERFDIQARTDGNPAKDTKDQMRLMMRTLLADRFGMKTRYEMRQVPVFALLLARPGKTGPRLQAHPEASSCSTVPPSHSSPAPPAVAGGYPVLCGGLLEMRPSASGRLRQGARNVTMGFIATQLAAMGKLGRPVIDRTGLGGTFDFALEWVPETDVSQPPGSDFQPDPMGPTFLEALREQLGLRLDSEKGPTEVLVVDHLEHPSGN